MSNSNYKRGRALEYKAMKYLRENGCSFVTRSAGSHSAADIVAVKDNQVLFVQVKAQGAASKADLEQLVELRCALPDCCEALLFEQIRYKGWKILMIGWSLRDIIEIENFKTL